jgi:UDP-N-acetylglucosamine acyltransferase
MADEMNPTAVRGSSWIHPKAQVSPHAVIGPGCWIGPKVVIHGGVRIGAYSVIGSHPEHSAFFNDDFSRTHGVVIDTGARIFEFVTIHAGTERPTQIRDAAAVFQHSHVSHDCDVGPGVTISGRSSLAGFVEVQQGAVVGAHAIIHQHCVVGAYSMLGMGSVLRAHIRPGQLWVGYPARMVGENERGLARAQLTMELVNQLHGQDFEKSTRRSKLL